MAVSGGLEGDIVLGSRSTHMAAQFGGYSGRHLRAGDVIGACDARPTDLSLAGRRWPRPVTDDTDPKVLRFTRFTGPGHVTTSQVRTLTHVTWQVSREANRMGIRFDCVDGAMPAKPRAELASFGVVGGAIQLPPDGRPVVLGADHQTTGGYPLIGVVVAADLPKVAQLSAGEPVRFMEVDLQSARQAYLASEEDLRLGCQSLGITYPGQARV